MMLIKKYTFEIALALVIITLSVLLLSSFQSDNALRKMQEAEAPQPSSDQVYFSQQNFRTVSFGTSRTWGAGLKNRDEETFTGLLNGLNHGIRSSNSDYPAMCTYSMLGEEIYDVITIEYMPLEYEHLHYSLLDLGSRLRKRFPDAMIIYVNIWSNHQFKLHGKGLYTLSGEIAQANGGNRTGILEQLVSNSEEEHWQFIETDEAWLREAINDPSINGMVLHYDLPQKGQFRDAIQALGKLYLDDITHFSVYGHEWISQQVMKILHESKHTRSDRVNPWETKDSCQSWIQTGQHNLVTTNMPMNSFSSGNKFALEASNPDLNFIEFDNDSNSSQHLYLTFMATSPNDLYGGATIELRTLPRANTFKTVKAETHMTWSVYPVHVMKHQYIGRVPPGKSYVVVNGNVSQQGTQPFRITGIVMTRTFLGETLSANLSKD